jgi:hypothetical protein
MTEVIACLICGRPMNGWRKPSWSFISNRPTPDLLRLRKEDEILAVWETHFDALR